MTARKLAAAAAASLTAAILLTGASTAIANASTLAAVPDGYGYWTHVGGTGSTLPLAEQNADFNAREAGCTPTTLVSDSESNGVWTAIVNAYCPYGS